MSVNINMVPIKAGIIRLIIQIKKVADKTAKILSITNPKSNNATEDLTLISAMAIEGIIDTRKNIVGIRIAASK